MDVGVTKSNKSHPFHYITGTIVFFMGYSAVMFMVRQMML